MSQWCRLYADMLNHRKIQQLDPFVFKCWVNALCLATEVERDGFLGTLHDISFAFREAPDVIGPVLKVLADLGFLVTDGETFRVRAFGERNGKSTTSTERVRRHRERQRDVSGNVSGNVSPRVSATSDGVDGRAEEAAFACEREALPEPHRNARNGHKSNSCVETLGNVSPSVSVTPQSRAEKSRAEIEGSARARVDDDDSWSATSGKPPAKKRQGSSLPKDFVVPDDWIQVGKGLRAKHGLPEINLRLEAERFRNHFGGNGVVKRDWLATWRNWCTSPLAKQDRVEGSTASAGHSNAGEDALWRARLREFRKKQLWLSQWGPEPGTPGCRVPTDVLEAESKDKGVGSLV